MEEIKGYPSHTELEALGDDFLAEEDSSYLDAVGAPDPPTGIPESKERVQVKRTVFIFVVMSVRLLAGFMRWVPASLVSRLILLQCWLPAAKHAIKTGNGRDLKTQSCLPNCLQTLYSLLIVRTYPIFFGHTGWSEIR